MIQIEPWYNRAERAILYVAWSSWAAVMLVGAITAAYDCDPLSYQNVSYAEPYRESCYEHDHWGNSKFIRDVRITDVLLAAFTGLLVLVGAVQASRLRGTINQMQATERRQLRAYVLVDVAHIENLVAGGIPRANIAIKNFGQTPAYHQRNWSRMGLQHFPTGIDHAAHRPIPGAATALGPSGVLYARPVLDRAISAAEITELGRLTPQIAIYVFGETTYVDAFGDERWTRYCLFAGGPAGVGGDLAAYQEGNEAN